MDQKILFEINKFKSAKIAKKQIPKAVFFTDQGKVKNIEKTIKSLPKGCGIIIREYHLVKEERLKFAERISKLAKRKGLKVIVGKDFDLAHKIHADGIHFSDFDKLPINFLKKNSFKKDFIFSLSCHSGKSFRKAQRLNPDLAFISPIFKTSSHADTKAIGLINLAKITFKNKRQKYRQLKIYTLGGISLVELKSIRKLPISGFGAIDLFTGDL